MTRRHWHLEVGVGGGYVPDVVMSFATKREALTALRLERDIHDEVYRGPDVPKAERLRRTGSLERGEFWWTGGFGVSRYVAIYPCAEDDPCGLAYDEGV